MSAIATSYASALFSLAEDAKTLDVVADDLRGIKAMLAQSSDLGRLVRSPMIARSQQAAAMEAVLAKAGVSELVRRFVAVVARNRRLFALSAMIEAYLAELAARRGEVKAEVTAAAPLDVAQTASLTDQLKKVLGAKVTVDVTVDPSIIGGLVVKVGSRLVDSSLSGKLARLQLAMKGNV